MTLAAGGAALHDPCSTLAYSQLFIEPLKDVTSKQSPLNF